MDDCEMNENSCDKKSVNLDKSDDDSNSIMEIQDIQCDEKAETTTEKPEVNATTSNEENKNSKTTSENKTPKTLSKNELQKQREAERERKEKEKKEREEQRIKREAEWKRKREEEEALKKQRAEKREQERLEREKRLQEEEALKKQRAEEREQERLERERKRLEEEALKKQRAEEREQERLEREKKKQELINAKNEEKKKREEERLRKEEEKLKEDEEKRRKAEKIKNQFASYFIKKEIQSNSSLGDDNKMYRFMPFQLKENMIVAPLCRRTDILNMNEEQRSDFISKLDHYIQFPEDSEPTPLYLEEIRKNPNLIRKQITTCRRKRTSQQKDNQESTEEIKIVAVITNLTKYKVKYLHFDPKVYRRPPYFGTWRKRSKFITPTNPFGKDDKLIDYDVDSDDEWEDEPEGESLDGSDKGDAEEEMLDEEDDDGFFVPHGHLSDDELDEDERELDPELKKAREDAKKELWEAERKKASKVLVPRCFNSYNMSKERLQNLKPNELKDLKNLNRLRMIPLATTFPIVIQNEEFLEKQAATRAAERAADDLANKAAAKLAKAAHLETTNNSSPTSNSKAKTNKLKQNAAQNSPTTSTLAQTSSTAAVSSTPPIINFISKMSNKKVVCKLESISGNNANTNPIQLIPIAKQQAPNNSSLTTSSMLSSSNGENVNVTPVLVPKLNESITKAQTPLANVTTTPSSKATPTSCTTAEKRISSFASNGNGEESGCVKRLKLDRDQSNDQPIAETIVVNKVGAASPSKAAVVISSLFKKSSFKKSIKPTPTTTTPAGAAGTTANQENTASPSSNNGVRRVTPQSVLQDCKDIKTNSPIKPAKTSSTNPEKETTESGQAKIKSYFSGGQKENSNDCLILDD